MTPYPTAGLSGQSLPTPNLAVDDVGRYIPPPCLTEVQPITLDGLTAPARGILPQQASGAGLLLIPAGQEIPSLT